MKITVPLVSVVIVNYNGAEYVADLIESLTKQSYPNFEVILVDNASEDESITIIKNSLKQLAHMRSVLIPLQQNVGFAEGNNIAVKASRGEFILFANTDITFEAKAMQRMVKALNKSLHIAGVAPKIYLSRFLPQKVFDSIGICVDGRASPYNRGIGQIDLGQYDHEEEIMGLCFAACLVRRDIYELTGGLDNSYFAYFEDVDWSIRVRKSGYQFWSCPQAIIYHYHSATTNQKAYAWKYYLIFRNYLRTVVKSLGKKQALKIAIRKSLDISKALVHRKTTGSMRWSMFKVLAGFLLIDWWSYVLKRARTHSTFIQFITDDKIFAYSNNEPSNFFDPVTLTPAVNMMMLHFIIQKISNRNSDTRMAQAFHRVSHYAYADPNKQQWEKRWVEFLKTYFPAHYKEKWTHTLFKPKKVKAI